MSSEGRDPMQVKISKRSAYAPIRYEATRPFAAAIARRFLAEEARGEQARLRFVKSDLFPLLSNAIGKGPNGAGPVQAEITNVQVFAHFISGGKIILDMSRTLSQC